MRYFFAALFGLVAAFANPFVIDFPDKIELTNDDYIEVQRKLRAIDIKPTLQRLYRPHREQWAPSAFEYRIGMGLRATLIDPAKGLYPIVHLEKIGDGGSNCVVSYASHNGRYPQLLQALPDALRACGFHGYLLYRIGGYPTPYPWTIRYAGVPYAFKIFMIMEAMKRGFKNVLWMDSAMLPLKDPTPLFERIEEVGMYFHTWKARLGPPAMLPLTAKVLQRIARIDMERHQVRYFIGRVFGCSRKFYKVRRFLRMYMAAVSLGTPFLAGFPEEFVLSAIVARIDRDEQWSDSFYEWFEKWPDHGVEDTPTQIERARKQGYRFYYRRH